ncbi:hypothetical protein LZ32DRAFT_25507 [Colletotrichum eremochloae]|nr:hypothetical protein LZ32DRAFT_25507 [Colletotrichum eremochloae]
MQGAQAYTHSGGAEGKDLSGMTVRRTGYGMSLASIKPLHAPFPCRCPIPVPMPLPMPLQTCLYSPEKNLSLHNARWHQPASGMLLPRPRISLIPHCRGGPASTQNVASTIPHQSAPFFPIATAENDRRYRPLVFKRERQG